MTEKQLIEKLNKLSDIRPTQEWVALTKQNILGNDLVNTEKFNLKEKFAGFVNIIGSLRLQTKLAYSFAVLLFAIVGTIGVAQKSVPGDMLFSIRRTTERLQTAFVGDETSKYNFDIANKRLEDLAMIVKDNKTENITPAITEFQASMVDATERLISAVKKNPKSIKDFAIEVKKINENAVLLDKIGGSNLQETSDNLYKAIVKEEIKALENSTLTEDQEKVLLEIKELFEENSFSEAFEKILTISN